MADRGWRDAERARALAWAILVLSAGGVAGWLVGERIVGATTSIHLVALFGGMSVFALVAAFAKDGLLALIELARYLGAGGERDGQLWRPMASLFVVALLGAMSVVVLIQLLQGRLPTCDEVRSPRGQEFGTISMNVLAKCMLDDLDRVEANVEKLSRVIRELDNTVSRIETRATPCPLLFENAGSSEDGGDLSGVGVSPEEAHMERLRSTADYLSENCSDTDLKLEITGYHSNAPFKKNDQSDELNEQAAKLRATTVAAALEDLLEERGVNAKFEVQYRRLDDPANPPSFTDAEALSLDDQWLISRSVFVRVTNPLSCSPLRKVLCEPEPEKPPKVADDAPPPPASGDET